MSDLVDAAQVFATLSLAYAVMATDDRRADAERQNARTRARYAADKAVYALRKVADEIEISVEALE